MRVKEFSPRLPQYLPLYFLVLLSMTNSVVSVSISSSRTELSFFNQESLQIDCVCHLTGNETELKSVELIRVLHHNKSAWTDLAKLSLADLYSVTRTGFQVTGDIGPTINDAFIRLFWETTSAEELGAYRCDLVGTDETNEYVIEKSNVLHIFEHNATVNELLDRSQLQIDSLQTEFDKFEKHTIKQMALLQKSVQELKNTSQTQDNSSEFDISDTARDEIKKEIRESILDLVSSQVQNMTCHRLYQCLDSNYSDDGERDNDVEPTESSVYTTRVEQSISSDSIKPDLEQNTKTTISAPNSVTTVLYWPKGEFGLLKPDSGCPVTQTSPEWSSGYTKYHTESVDENHDNVSSPNHLALPISEIDSSGNHFLYMHFCLHKSESKNHDWPAGSYCIHQVGIQCPSGFYQGYVDIDEEDDNFKGKSSGSVPNMLFYCCRIDGPADQPIALPVAKPFYLYRIGGRCQEVQQMQVASENMTFDTENENNEDGYGNDYHPDGHLSDVRIELCYYS